jgi:molybdopterin-guanine dinucleotide biosynthesis protein A
MGHDKGQLKLKGATLVRRASLAARGAGLPVRVIRRDLIPRCGPLGGVFTALATSHFEATLFIACDMPFLESLFIARMIARFASAKGGRRPFFSRSEGKIGFPFILRKTDLPVVQAQINKGELSVVALCRAVQARIFVPSARQAANLMNVNTPMEWKAALKRAKGAN